MTTSMLVTSPVFAWFGGAPGFWEIMLILALMLLLFGKRLPEVGRSLGRGLVEFKKGIKGIEDEVNAVDVEVVRDKNQKSGEQQQQQENRSLPQSGEQPTTPTSAGAAQPEKQQEEVSKSA